MSAVEVCAECDIADCHHIRERRKVMNPAEIAAMAEMVANLLAQVDSLSAQLAATLQREAATQSKHDVKIYAMTAERDYDRRATAHLQTVIDKLNAQLAAVTAEREAAVAQTILALSAQLAAATSERNFLQAQCEAMREMAPKPREDMLKTQIQEMHKRKGTQI